MTRTTAPTTAQLTDQMKVVAAAASASLDLARVGEGRTGQIGLIKEHSPLQARMRVEEGRIVARLTGRPDRAAPPTGEVGGAVSCP